MTSHRRAKPSDTIDGQPLGDEARSKQYKLLVRLADKSSRKADWTEASRRLEIAAKVARNDRDRLSARLRLASAQTKAGHPKAAVATFQEILGNAKLHGQLVGRVHGPVALAVGRLGGLLQQRDDRLAGAFDRVRVGHRFPRLPRLARRFGRRPPHAETQPAGE